MRYISQPSHNIILNRISMSFTSEAEKCVKTHADEIKNKKLAGRRVECGWVKIEIWGEVAEPSYCFEGENFNRKFHEQVNHGSSDQVNQSELI